MTTIDLKNVSAADLEAALKTKKEEERKQALDKRATYEGIRADVNYKIESKVRAVVTDVRALFDFVVAESSAFYEVMKEYGQLRTDNQMSFKIPGDKFKVEVIRNKVKKFDERADVAAARLIEFLRAWISNNGKGEDDPMYQLTMTLLERNQYGDLDYKSISKLYDYEQKFNDPEYSSIMQLFKESNVVEGTAVNFYFFEKTDLGVWRKLEVNFNRL